MNKFDTFYKKIINENNVSSDITVGYIGEDDGEPACTLEYKGKKFGFWYIENPAIINALDNKSHKQHAQVTNYLKYYLDKFIVGERDEEGADTLQVPKFGQLALDFPM